MINCAQWHFLSWSPALNWALKESAQQHHLEEESFTENGDTNCSWKAFISKYLSVSAKLQKSWPRAAGTLSAAASKEEEPGCLTYKPQGYGVCKWGTAERKGKIFISPSCTNSFTTCIITTWAFLTILQWYSLIAVMKYTQSQSEICRANRLCAAQGWGEQAQLKHKTRHFHQLCHCQAAAQQGFSVKSLHNMMVMSFSAIIMSLSDGNKMEYLSLLLVHSENMQICQSSLYLDRNKIH